jgi:hypothetical protein
MKPMLLVTQSARLHEVAGRVAIDGFMVNLSLPNNHYIPLQH